MQLTRVKRYNVVCKPAAVKPRPPKNKLGRIGELYLFLMENKSKVTENVMNTDKLEKPLRPIEEVEYIRQEAAEKHWKREKRDRESGRDRSSRASSEQYSDDGLPDELRGPSGESSDDWEAPELDFSSRFNPHESAGTSRNISRKIQALLSTHNEPFRDYSSSSDNSVGSVRHQYRESPRESHREHRRKHHSRKTSRRSDRHSSSSDREEGPPRLSHVMPEAVREKNLPPVDDDTTDVRKALDSLIFKIYVMKRCYPNNQEVIRLHQFADDPETQDMNMSDDRIIAKTKEIRLAYDRTMRKLYLDDSIDSNKNMLLMMFLIIEAVGTGVFKLPLAGYMRAQIGNMGKYERMLIEMGEKSYLKKKKNSWPVEVRLIITAVVQAAMFMAARFSLNSVMSGLTGNLHGVSSGSIPTAHPRPMPTPRRQPTTGQSTGRMSGPTLTPEEIDQWMDTGAEDDAASVRTMNSSVFTDMPAIPIEP